MAICNALTAAVSKSCDNSVGGIKRMFIANFDNVTGTTVSNGEVTVIGMSSGTKFYEFAFNKNTSNAEETIAVDFAAGNSLVTQTVNLILTRRDKLKREAIVKLASGQQRLAIIFQDSNGLYWFQGLTDGTYLTGLAGGTGVNKTDRNSYDLTFTAEEPSPMPEVDDAIIAAIIVAAT
jgi:hypothetical protein